MRTILLLIVASLTAVSAFGQSVSTKQDLAIFQLSFYNFAVPVNALGQVDSEIQDVFINLGRFNVIGMNYRLDESDVNDFIAKLKLLKESQAVIPEEMHLGKVAFTEADLNRIAGSFIVVIPVLTSYTLEFQYGSGYTAQLATSFTFISVADSKAIAHFTIRTIGTASDPNDAISDAASGIPIQLQYEIRSVPAFQLKTGIVEVEGNTVLIQFGRDMGVRPGDEYSIITSRVLPSGITVNDQTGLVLVKEVQDTASYAQIIYSDHPPHVGVQLKEIPRLGFDASFYAHGVMSFGAGSASLFPVVLVGTYETFTRGFYNFRPLVGIEVPAFTTTYGGTNAYGFGGLPLNFYAGGELNWRFWRFDLSPLAAVGLGGLVPVSESESFDLTLFGGFVQLSLSYLVTQNTRVLVNAGYAQWLAFSPWNSGYGGFYGGAGIAVSF